MIKLKNILVLAGGDSSRFWPLKKKAYFSFLNQPLICHQLEFLKKITENLAVVVNPDDFSLAKHLFASNIKLITQKKGPANQATALISAKNDIFGEVLIVNAEDIFNRKTLAHCINTMIQTRPDFAFLAKKVQNYFPGGYVRFEKDKVIEIIEKPSPEKTPSSTIKLVVDYFRDFQKLIKLLRISDAQRDDSYEQAINQLLKEKIKVKLVLYNDYWYPLKYPWHVLKMMDYFLKSQGKTLKLGKGVKIAKTAKIEGPCFIGDHTIIGDFCLIRQSHIGKNCLVGGFCEITRSYLGNNVSLHRNYVGDSVLDDDVQMGAGAATANFRFDQKIIKSKINNIKIATNLAKFGSILGKGCKIGVNSTILPGVKIGGNTFVGPGETISSDIDEEKFIFKNKQTNNQVTKSK